jgi:ribosomal protein L30/L7E
VRRVRAAITRLKDRARIERDAKSTLKMLGV